MSRAELTPFETVEDLWKLLELPREALKSLNLDVERLMLPSSFKIGHLALTSIGLTGLLAALIHNRHNLGSIPRVNLSQSHAAAEFKSEHLLLIDGQKLKSAWGPIGGLHKTIDGYVRVHDNFPHHMSGTLALLGCPAHATRDDVSKAISRWKSLDLEDEAASKGLVIAALRNYEEWDHTPQATAVSDFPISIKKIAGSPPISADGFVNGRRCLAGLRVLDLSRVIAAPVAGRTLAAHGADVLWITSPSLPDLPSIDKDFARGKRTAQLNLNDMSEMKKLKTLLRDTDVFLQSYRPGSLAARGISAAQILADRAEKPIICADLSAYGPTGPWGDRRGFDSLVQTCSGMNVSEAEHFEEGEAARPMPCQALDHAAGYFLAAGIMAAIYRQTVEGGSYAVHVSLAGVMRYLRSLGQYDGKSGFVHPDYLSVEDAPPEYIAKAESEFGTIQYVKHAISIEGADVGWDIMPKPLGSDPPVWIA